MVNSAILFRYILRHLGQNAIRTGLTVLGITLGVAILLAIHLANQSVLAQFRASIDTVTGKANLVVRSQSVPDFPESVLPAIRWVWLTGGTFSPVLEQTGTIPGPDGQSGEVVQLVGLNFLSQNNVETHWIDLQKAPQDPLAILQPRAAFVGAELARTLGLSQAPIGTRFLLLINDRQESLTLAGILSDKGLGGAYSGNLVVMDLDGLQQLVGQPETISRIDLVVPEPLVEPIRQKLVGDLSPALTAERPAQRGQQVENMIRSFQYNLTALSFIALLVGMFLIYNTMSISVLRRRQEIGTLRAIGASKAQVFGLFGLEVGVLGLVGTLAGIGLGIGLAQAALSSVSQTVEALYVTQTVQQITIDPLSLLIVGLLGVGLTLLAALPPLMEAASVPPAEATRRRSEETRLESRAPWLAAAGLVLWAIALWAARQPAVGGLPLYGYLAALLAVLGGALVMPILLRGLLAGLAPLVRHLLGLEGHLARLMVQGALGRSAVAVASLMVGIAMMISLAVMIGSFRNTVITWVNQTFKADLLVKPAARLTSKVTSQLSPQVVATIAQTPGVAAVDRFYEAPITIQGQLTNLGVGDLEVLTERGNLQFVDNVSSKTVYQRLQQLGGVMVTENFALKTGLDRGDQLTIPTPSGPVTLTIEGVYYDYASEQGYVILPRPLYRRYFKNDPVTDLAVYLDPGTDAEVVRREILQRVGPGRQLILSTQQEIKQEVLRIFDNTFSITYALHFIAIAVAILGVMNTLFAMVLESRREFGILRYVGASQPQIKRIVLYQAGLLGLFGNLTGLGMGLILSLLLIHVINKQSFGWTVQFSLEPLFLLQSFVIVMVTALLSGAIPARLAAQLPAPEVIREE
jgi:putative ABC transport system permease protein